MQLRSIKAEARRDELTARLVGTPDSMKQIADAMGITANGLNQHARIVYRRAGVGDRVGLMLQEIKRLRVLAGEPS
jgi:DNA-binding CsgD family transcriptional regulator